MNAADQPRPYPSWRKSAADREEDAAHSFGYYLMLHCREEALAKVSELPASARAATEGAVDTALHNLCAMLEGFWPLRAGPQHQVELVLGVRVRDERGAVVETIELSPSKLDLPIGYWGWVHERSFQ